MKHYLPNQHLIITLYSQTMSHDVTQCNLYRHGPCLWILTIYRREQTATKKLIFFKKVVNVCIQCKKIVIHNFIIVVETLTDKH